jgi:sigma-E factor negative regulatory protein RseA
MVMNENISRLMDGEIDASEVDVVCVALKRHDTMATWTCYHVIGDAMRGSGTPRDGFAASFAKRFAEEPTVLAPAPLRARPATIATWGWAIAATLAAVTVVGWTATSLLGETPAAVAKAGEAIAVNAARVRPATVPADYLLAHQEYSPGAAIRGVGPYVRAVATQDGDRP